MLLSFWFNALNCAFSLTRSTNHVKSIATIKRTSSQFGLCSSFLAFSLEIINDPYSPDYVSKQFNKLLKKHNLPHIRFHELRHSCASMLLAMGWNLKDIQEWLGYSDIKMTANLYSHLDVTRKNNIANSLAEKFGV